MKKLLLLLLCVTLLFSCGGGEKINISETEFLNKVENNEVKSVTFVTNAGYAEVEMNNSTKGFNFRYSDIKYLKEQIRLRNSDNHQIIIDAKEESKMFGEIFGWTLPLVFFIGIWVVIIFVIILIIRYFLKNRK